ncbi:energy transducer TonB [Sulfurimonas sp. MAG313]|nr:energy transducer TonB [Sulfurimonas sp. MAG313]MDF1880155.1 energy transducer TonB [Sulfurimonas sp. MAG313]
MLVLLSIYYYKKDTDETYCLVDLKRMKISMPSVQKKVEIQDLKKIETKPKVNKKLSKPLVKKEKSFEKPKKVKKIVPIKKVVLANEKIVENNKIREKKSEIKTSKKELEIVKKITPVSTLNAVKLSYEARYLEENLALINTLIKKNLNYPRLAKKRGLEGKVIVSFTLGLEGKVFGVQVQGNVSSILKKSAIKTVKRASASFPHPSQILALRIPIVYKLH